MNDTTDPSVEFRPATDAAKNRLSLFMQRHPNAEVTSVFFNGEDNGHITIDNLWDDQSVGIWLDSDDVELEKVLNKLSFPRLLSAILHNEDKMLEVIWTAYELPEGRDEISSREFTFVYKGKSHICKFGGSSHELLIIAKHVGLLTSSDTNFRNLQSFRAFARESENDTNDDDVSNKSEMQRGVDKPRCFFISNFDFNDDETIEFVRHLNFYMSYFDTKTPTVLLHLPQDEGEGKLKSSRYVRGVFPSEIKSDILDSNLLSFWNASKGHNPMMDFIICYRIIEYVSMHFVDYGVRTRFKRLLKSPCFGQDISKDVEELAFISNSKLDEFQRMKALIRQNVDPRILWPEVDSNRDLFAKPAIFDGGYTHKALINAKDNKDQFIEHGFHNISDSFRKLRNALSHGKDLETAGVITPTLRNFDLMRPYVHLINIVAGEVILYKDVA